MGYTTDFDGIFELNKPLNEETETYLKNFSRTRRMKRDPKKLEEMGYGPAESFGIEGEFFVNTDDLDNFGQSNDDSVLDHNSPPRTQPGLWCQWTPTDDGLGIEWDGGEKFYHATVWIEYLIDNILAPRGYVLNGVVDATGEDYDDQWHIEIKDNIVEERQGHYGYYDKWEQFENFLNDLTNQYTSKGNDEVVKVIEQIYNKSKELR